MLSALIILQFIIYYSNGQITPTVLSSSAELTTATPALISTVVEEIPATTSTETPALISTTVEEIPATTIAETLMPLISTTVEELPVPITSEEFPAGITSTILTDSSSEEFPAGISSTILTDSSSEEIPPEITTITDSSEETVSNELPFFLSVEECEALIEAYQNGEITSVQIDTFMETCELDCSFEFVGIADGSNSDSNSDSIETFEVPDDGCDCSLFECKSTTVNNGNLAGIKIGLVFIALECLIMK